MTYPAAAPDTTRPPPRPPVACAPRLARLRTAARRVRAVGNRFRAPREQRAARRPPTCCAPRGRKPRAAHSAARCPRRSRVKPAVSCSARPAGCCSAPCSGCRASPHAWSAELRHVQAGLAVRVDSADFRVVRPRRRRQGRVPVARRAAARRRAHLRRHSRGAARVCRRRRALRYSRLQLVRHVILPAALPSIFTGLYLGLIYSWLATLGAEYLLVAGSGSAIR